MASSSVSDLLGQIPWQYADCFVSKEDGGLKIMRVLRLLKMLRLRRVGGMLEAVYRRYPRSKVPMTGIELMMRMVIVTHWVACAWFLVGYPTKLPADGWFFSDGIVDEKLVQLNDPGSRYFEWITAFYWAMTTMSTIGYGDISAHTAKERTVAVLFMWLGCAFFSYIVGRFTHLLTKESICSIQFEDKMEALLEWMDARSLSPEILERIKAFHRMCFPTSKVFNETKKVFKETKILTDLPASLRKETYVELCYDIELCYASTLSLDQPNSSSQLRARCLTRCTLSARDSRLVARKEVFEEHRARGHVWRKSACWPLSKRASISNCCGSHHG